MKKLEFLLQKEGDRAWLPLETPDVEILEGRYRVVARVPHPNTDIEIRVSYTSLLQVPPQRHQRSAGQRVDEVRLAVWRACGDGRNRITRPEIQNARVVVA